MHLIIAIGNAKLKGDRLQEEGKTTTKSELGAWSLGAWRSGEARLLYGSSQSDNHSQQEGPTHHNPTPPKPLAQRLGDKANGALLRHTR